MVGEEELYIIFSFADSYIEQLLMYEGRGVMLCVWVIGNTIHINMKVCKSITAMSLNVCLRKGYETAAVQHKHEVCLGVA